jgi:hypothetical protein
MDYQVGFATQTECDLFPVTRFLADMNPVLARRPPREESETVGQSTP